MRLAQANSMIAVRLSLALSICISPAFADSIANIEPLGAAAAKNGLTVADVAKIRGAAGRLFCRMPGGPTTPWAITWVINSGQQILTVAHAFVDHRARSIFRPSDCYFTPSTEQKRRIAINSLAIRRDTNYLYLRNRAGKPPELVQERRYRGGNPSPDRTLIHSVMAEDYVILDLKQWLHRSAGLDLDFADDLARRSSYDEQLFLVSLVPPSIGTRLRSDTHVIQRCKKVRFLALLNQIGPWVTRTDCYGEPGMSGGLFFRKKGGRLVAAAMLIGGEKKEGLFTDGLTFDGYFHDSLPTRNFFRTRPVDADFFASRGKLYVARKNYPDAITDFDEAIRRDSTHADAFAHRGVAYRRHGQLGRAIADFSEAIRLDPNSSVAFAGRGSAYHAMRDYDRAVEDYSSALRLKPDDAGFLNGRCWTRAIAGRELNEALADCNASLRIRPADVDTLESRGLVHLKLRQFDEAIADYTAALEERPEYTSALFGRGYAKRKNGDIAGGDVDIAAAEAIDNNIAKKYASYGLD